MNYKSFFNNKGYSLIGLCIVAVIVVIGVLYFSGLMFKSGEKPDTLTDYSNSQKKTTYGQSMDAAKAVECQSNLGQIRNAISISMQSGEQPPQSLKEIQGFPEEMFSCAVTKQAYVYDPQTGVVKCPSHPDF